MRTLFRFHRKPDTPIVCDFTEASDTPQERFAEYGRLFNASPIDRERTINGVVLTFEPGAGVAEWVADLAAREAACCPFLSYEVTTDRSATKWTTWGTDAVQTILDEFYALYEAVRSSTSGELFAGTATEDLEGRVPEPNHR